MQSLIAGKPGDFEEDFFLVEASTDAEARKEARRLAKAEEQSYPNAYGEEVSWRFLAITDLTDLNTSRLKDGMWLYRRQFPGRSRLVENGERIRVNGQLPSHNGNADWNGGMLLFRTLKRPYREEERLLLFRATSNDAVPKALVLGKQLTEKEQLDLLGMFKVVDLFDKQLRSGTEVYWRFFSPGRLKTPECPPRERHLLVPSFSKRRARLRASA
jgi:hypothetical protein